jgi:hypothetical protein
MFQNCFGGRIVGASVEQEAQGRQEPTPGVKVIKTFILVTEGRIKLDCLFVPGKSFQASKFSSLPIGSP